MSHYLIEQIESARQHHGAHRAPRSSTPSTATTTWSGIWRCANTADRRTRDSVSCGRLFVFIGAEPRTDWLDGVVVRDDHGFVADRPGPARTSAAGRWTGRPYHLETSVPGRVRRRRRARRVGQAGRVGRRRGLDGGDAGAPLPGRDLGDGPS